MKVRQKNNNYNLILYNININNVLISSYYNKKGYTLNIKLSKSGKKTIAGIISGNGERFYYSVIKVLIIKI